MTEFGEIQAMIKSYENRTPDYYGCALAGELGEACNLIKKEVRDGLDVASFEKLGQELADIFIYSELIARKHGLDLEECILNKIAINDEKYGAEHITE